MPPTLSICPLGIERLGVRRNKMKIAFVNIVACLLLAIFNCEAITMEGFRMASQQIGLFCRPKFNELSNETIDQFTETHTSDSADLKCYTNCILELLQLMKDGKFRYEASMQGIEKAVPDEMRAATRNSIELCKDAGNGIESACDTAYAVVQCFFRTNPAFVLPK